MWQNFLHWIDENKIPFVYWIWRFASFGFRFSKKTISKTDKQGSQVTETEKSFEYGGNGSSGTGREIQD